MARVQQFRQPRTEEDREEMSPVVVGLTIGVGGITGLALGLAIKSALSDSDAPFEASLEAIERVASFVGDEGQTFADHSLRGAGLAAVLTVAPFLKIPEDLDPRELPAAIPASPEAAIDYAEDFLGAEIDQKKAKKIRRKFERLEREFSKEDDESGTATQKTDDGDPVDEEEEDDDEEEAE